jgi:D-amino peptidase
VANLWLNDVLAGETALNAAVAGHYGVPVLMVSGDQTVCLQALELLGDVEVASVKKASGYTSAECLPPEISQEKICDAAARAVLKLGNGRAPAPYRLTEPIRVMIEFHHSGQADRAAILPDTQRLDGRKIAFSAADMITAYRAFRAAVALSKT